MSGSRESDDDVSRGASSEPEASEHGDASGGSDARESATQSESPAGPSAGSGDGGGETDTTEAGATADDERKNDREPDDEPEIEVAIEIEGEGDAGRMLGAADGEVAVELELFSDPEHDEDFEDDDLATASAQKADQTALADDVFPPRPLRIITVTGARGGVGKTVLAANLGLYLATIGRRVVLVDADPGGANLHTCLGTAPAPALARLRRQQRGEGGGVAEALRDTPFRGLRLLHLGLDEPGGAAARADRMTKLMPLLHELEAEYAVVDLGIAVGKESLDNYLSADVAVFVTVPEPTAIENTYRFLRASFVRFLLARLPDDDARGELDRLVRAHGGTPAPLDLWQELERERHPFANAVREAMEAFRPHLIVNQTRLRADLQLGHAMASAARRRLGLTLDYLGHIDNDDTVWACVRNRRPLLLEVPGAKCSRRIEKLARRLQLIEAGKDMPGLLYGVPVDSYHDLLEVERGATDEEIRRAYKRCREVYSHDALCCYGLLESSEIEKLRARIDEAFDVLLDPARRRPYELSVFPDEPEPARELPEEPVEEPLRPAPEIAPDTQFTGQLLRQVRESQRVSLRDISQRTKISLSYLKAIEEDDFTRLPALVYTTGFVTEFARFLKLESQQVSRTYVSRYRRFLESKERSLARKH